MDRIRVDQEGWTNWVDWADVVTVSGSEHRGPVVDFIRKRGVPVAGPGSWGAALELNREFGFEIFKKMGMNPPSSRSFDSIDSLVKYVVKNPARYVLKLDQTFREVAETYVGRDPDGGDLIGEAKAIASKLWYAGNRLRFYLQDFLEGVEVGVTGWFNGETFVGGLRLGYESRHGFVYDMRVDGSALVDQPKIETVLREAGFRGLIDLNGILVGRTFRPIEFTPRWGKGMTEFACFAAPDLGEVLQAVATGGKVNPYESGLNGKVVALVNSIVHGETVHEITTPDGIPVLRKDSGFFVEWPTRNSEGRWLALPCDVLDKRWSMYLGVGKDLDAALAKAEAMSKEVYIADSGIAPAQLKDDVEAGMDRVRSVLKKEEWIEDVAKEMKHVWGG
jgi:hypothetical protein